MSGFQVTLPRFEGPLDLLLFLVSRKEYDIMDLPMAEITESYLEAIDTIGVDNLEDAGDYLLMAATLLAIKARMLLPQPEVEALEEIEDPRRELAERLLIYQKVREVASEFSEWEADMLARSELGLSAVPAEANPSPEETLFPMTIYDLTRAIEDILQRKEQRFFHDVALINVTMKDRVRWIVDILMKEDTFGLCARLGSQAERMLWVVTMLAILELAKQGRIRVEQNAPFEEIYISRDARHETQAA
ncbi:segregation/condensation protein A [bacterium]|nr:segregation/condensation protein A [bacterium]MBU1919597.1 segregation/condensation protein A [bacterium]